MDRKKGAIGLFGLVLVGIALLGVMYLVQSDWINRGFKIRSEARIYVNLEDESSKIVSILKSRTDEHSFMEFLMRETLSLPNDASESAIISLADELDMAIITYHDDGKVKKRFGSRVPSEDDIVYLEIPLPGGETTFIGVSSDMGDTDHAGAPGKTTGSTSSGGS